MSFFVYLIPTDFLLCNEGVFFELQYQRKLGFYGKLYPDIVKILCLVHIHEHYIVAVVSFFDHIWNFFLWEHGRWKTFYFLWGLWHHSLHIHKPVLGIVWNLSIEYSRYIDLFTNWFSLSSKYLWLYIHIAIGINFQRCPSLLLIYTLSKVKPYYQRLFQFSAYNNIILETVFYVHCQLYYPYHT